jgi:Tfp pilus assembly protein PilE
MSKHRLPAYTIMELTVAMLISAIVIGITYTAFNIVSSSYRNYQVKHNQLSVLIRLDELLEKDFSKAEGIYKEQDGIKILINQQTVTYRFLPGQVIRISTIADTFSVVANDLTFSFERQPLTAEPATDEELNRADELSFNVLLKEEKFPYHYLKQYSSQNLMNRRSHAYN